MKQSQTKKKVNRTFTLKNIDTAAADIKYGINIASKPDTDDLVFNMPQNITKIDELSSTDKQNNVFSFIDDTHKYYITMIDSITNEKIDCHYCFWCRNHFDTQPIGCPIRYIPDNMVQMCTSEITKETYSIIQPIPKCISGSKHKIIPKGYYKTDGSFCSFNCCIAYIRDNVHNSMYSNSENLLMKMYIEVFGKEKLAKITPAPSWRLLREYGGFMSIKEYRESFSNYIYIDMNYPISRIPKAHPVGYVFEEHYIF